MLTYTTGIRPYVAETAPDVINWSNMQLLKGWVKHMRLRPFLQRSAASRGHEPNPGCCWGFPLQLCLPFHGLISELFGRSPFLFFPADTGRD